MATCIRKLSKRLCCTKYFKPLYSIHAKNSTSNYRKPVQQWLSTDERNTLNFGTIHRIPASSQLCCFNKAVEKNIDSICHFPISKSNISTVFRQNSDLDMSSSSVSGGDRYYMKVSIPDRNTTDDHSSKTHGRPSEEQLDKVFDELSTFLPKLFYQGMNPEFYSKNIVLENRIRGTRTVGVGKYVSQLALLKIVAHFKFASVRFYVLKITKHPEDGTIKCRWRIAGVPGFEVIFQFWKFTPSKINDRVTNAPTWYDGFSTYVVGSDGTIHKHIIDKMMPDDDKIKMDKSFASKVTLCLGLLPPEQGELLKGMVRSSSDHPWYMSQVMLPLEKISVAH